MQNGQEVLSLREVVRRGFQVLDRRDQIKSLYVILIHCFLGIADVLGVLIIGLMGSLAISGISSKQPGDRTRLILGWLGIDGRELINVNVRLGLCNSLEPVFNIPLWFHPLMRMSAH